MKTFQDVFCEKHRCDPERFRRKVFWQTLHPHAVLVAPFLGGFNARLFAADRELLQGVSRAKNMNRVRDEIVDYFLDSQNQGWLHNVANIRISTHRLKNLAKQYLPNPSGA